MIYISLLFLLLLFHAITNKKESLLLFYFFSMVLIIMSCLRYGSGTDYWNYKVLFNLVPDDLSLISTKNFLRLEPTFTFIAVFCKQLGLSFEILIIIYAVLSLIFILKSILKFSNYFLISLLIFFCNYYLIYIDSAIRQGVAMSISLYTILCFIENQSKKKYFLGILIAFLFHYSALILFFIPIILKLPKKLFFDRALVFSLSIVFILVGKFLPNFLLKLIFIFVPKYGAYITLKNDTNYLALMLRILMLCFVLVMYYNNKNITKFTQKIVKIYICGIFIFFMLHSVSILSRLTEYFFLLEIIILPNLLIHKKAYSFDNRIYKFIFCILFSFLFIKDVVSFLNFGGYYSKKIYDYPYITVFNKDDYKKFADSPREDLK